MKYALTLDEIKKAERKIGLKAARLVKKSVIQSIEKFNLIGDASSDTHLKKSVKSSVVMGDVRLFRISTTMQRHGFIQQHGVNGKRTGHIRKKGKWKNARESGFKNKSPFYSVKEHGFILAKKPFIEEGIENSGAFEVLFNELGELRMKEVAIVFQKLDMKIT